MSEPIKPWRPLPVLSCEFCDRQASCRVASVEISIPVFSEPVGAWQAHMEDRPDIESHLVCRDHLEATMDAVSDRYGGSSSYSLRDTWKVWYFCETRIGRMHAHILGRRRCR